MIDCIYVSLSSRIMWENILRHLSVEKLEFKRSGKNVLSWARPPLFENNICRHSPRLNMPTLWTLHLLFACILSLYSIWFRVVFKLQDKIFCREWNEVLIWNGALTGAGTRGIMFFASSLVAGLEGREPHCQMAKYSCLSARRQLNITSARPALSSPPFLLVHKQYFAQCLHLYNQFFVFLALYFNTLALCIIILLRAAPLSGGDRGYLSCRGR